MALALVASAARTQPATEKRAGIIDGIVTDSSLVALSQAEVTLFGSTVKVETGADGRFRILQVPEGEYIMVVRKLGFHPLSSVIAVATGEPVRITAELTRIPPGLDTVRVVTTRSSMRMMEFDYRRQHLDGQFFTTADFKRRPVAYVSDFLYNLRGLRMMTTGGGGGQYQKIAVSSRSGTFNGPCVMQVLLDGMPMPSPYDLDLLPGPSLLAGIEVYVGAATIPANLGSMAGGRWCGVIAVWTKDGTEP